MSRKLQTAAEIATIIGVGIALIALYPAFAALQHPDPTATTFLTITPSATHVEVTSSPPSPTPTVDPAVSPTPLPTTTYLGSTLLESIWLNDQSWSRNLPILNGNPQQGFSDDWTLSANLNQIPGSGKIQASSDFIINDSLYRYVWRNNQGWLLIVPIVDGSIQWGKSSQWNGPLSIGEFPGKGEIQAVGDISTGNDLHRSLWRGGVGWYTTIPIVDGNVKWSRAVWSGPVSTEILPGGGDVQAASNAALGNEMRQTIWRSDQGWYRIVPIVDDNIDWGSASKWFSIDGIPNGTVIQAFSDTDLP